MKVEYDKYYLTENLFGNPYPELVDFYSKIESRGKLLDIGCGQGRDAIALAKLGFEVTGIDHSKVGIEQLNIIAKKEKLSLQGVVADIFDYSDFDQFDFILLDSMFHFNKKDLAKETALLNRIFDDAKSKSIITICIQKTGKKLGILESIIKNRNDLQITYQTELIYIYEDSATNHRSESKYEMISVEKILREEVGDLSFKPG